MNRRAANTHRKDVATVDLRRTTVMSTGGAIGAVLKMVAVCNRGTTANPAITAVLVQLDAREIVTRPSPERGCHGQRTSGPGRSVPERCAVGQRSGGVGVDRRDATRSRSMRPRTSRASAVPIADPSATERTKMPTTTRNKTMAPSQAFVPCQSRKCAVLHTRAFRPLWTDDRRSRCPAPSVLAGLLLGRVCGVRLRRRLHGHRRGRQGLALARVSNRHGRPDVDRALTRR
jgi:hypothetical protein